MGDAFTSQGTTDRHTVSPEGQGTGAPSWPQEAPTLQTDSLVLTSGPQRGERVYSVPLVETGPAAWGSQDPLLCWLAVLCRHEPPRDLHQLLPGPKPGMGGRGWVQGAARLGGEPLWRQTEAGGKQTGGAAQGSMCSPVERRREIHFQGPPGNTGPGSLPPQGLHVCLCVPGGSCLQVLWGHC